MTTEFDYTISYGKSGVPLCRVYAAPLSGLTPIPESSFTGRPNTIFSTEVDVEVFGTNFLPSYTEGDNSSVVATDSMKNFILREALAYEGATLEGFLDFLGRRFLATYPEMQRLRLTARELPFSAARVPQQGGSFGDSTVLFHRAHGDYAFAQIECEGVDATYTVTGHRCGHRGLHLMKVTGSSFTRFRRDSYTTLPERVDRPLFIVMDLFWRYTTHTMLLGPTAGYVAAEQVRDLVTAVFDEFVSESIQQLVHVMGLRLLERFPQLAELHFEAHNHTWDPAALSEDDPRVKVYAPPFPAYGLIKLTLQRKA